MNTSWNEMLFGAPVLSLWRRPAKLFSSKEASICVSTVLYSTEQRYVIDSARLMQLADSWVIRAHAGALCRLPSAPKSLAYGH